MQLGADHATALSRARERLLGALREHALVIGEVTLTSGRTAQYYVDAKRAILLPDVYAALGLLVAEQARACSADAVGGVPVSAIPVACAALGSPRPPARMFIVRKERKRHGLQRWLEGPPLAPAERCLIVEDVVTSGGSTIEAVRRARGEGVVVAGVLCVLDRLAGGREAIETELGTGAAFSALATIDDVYPDRPDRPAVAATGKRGR
jgi:orotate phosphoribosyltransferase